MAEYTEEERLFAELAHECQDPVVKWAYMMVLGTMLNDRLVAEAPEDPAEKPVT